MTIDPNPIFILLGLTLVIGYIGALFFDRTKIPDIIWLLLFGLLIGPVSQLVFQFTSRQSFLDISGVLGSFALLLILFEAGLNIDFYQLVRGLSRSLGLAILTVILTMAAVSLISIFLFNFDLETGLLLGAIIGGTSSPVVLSITKNITIRDNVKTILNLESILTDPIIVIFAIAILQYIVEAGSASPIQNVLAAFSIGAMLGGILGIVWLFILDKIQHKAYDYMFTLGALFLLFSFTELNGGSGAIASLAFGIVLGNAPTFSSILKLKKQFKVDRLLKLFQSELSFFIESFFFVFLGIIFLAKPIFIYYGLILSAVVIIMRLVAAKLATVGMELQKNEVHFINSMIPRGLAAAVLSQFPAQAPYASHFSDKTTDIFSSVVLVVIMVSIIYSVVMTQIFNNRQEAADQAEKEEDTQTGIKTRDE